MRKVLFLFGQVNDEDIEWMLDVGHRQAVPEGRVLIREGEDIDAVYVVLDGTLDCGKVYPPIARPMCSWTLLDSASGLNRSMAEPASHHPVCPSGM